MNYNPFTLKGKTILVTGASSGIGRATAIECSKMGAKLIITGRNESRLKETLNALEDSGHQMFVADLTSEEEYSIIVKDCPQIDGLVNAAGVGHTKLFNFITKKDIEEVFNINIINPVLFTKNLIKNKKVRKGASIVWISSVDGPITVHLGNSLYSGTKGAISAIAKNMAVDLAVKGIRVNCVLPGMTETPLIHNGSISEEDLEKDKNNYPLRRYADPKEIALGIIYLLSDASSFTTGVNLVIDGGMTLL